MLSLMETIWVMLFSNGSRAEKLTNEQFSCLLYLVTSYCHLGKSAESLFVED
jgi:hypothetical protein